MGSSCSAHPSRQMSGGAEDYTVARQQSRGGVEDHVVQLVIPPDATQEQSLRRANSLSTATLMTIATSSVVVGDAHTHRSRSQSPSVPSATREVRNTTLNAVDERLLLEFTMTSAVSSDGAVSLAALPSPQGVVDHGHTKTTQQQHLSDGGSNPAASGRGAGLSSSAVTAAAQHNHHHLCHTPKLIASSFVSSSVMLSNDDFVLSPATTAATAAAAAAAANLSIGDTCNATEAAHNGGDPHDSSASCLPQVLHQHPGDNKATTHEQQQQPGGMTSRQHQRAQLVHSVEGNMAWSMMNTNDIIQLTERSPSTTSSDDPGEPCAVRTTSGVLALVAQAEDAHATSPLLAS